MNYMRRKLLNVKMAGALTVFMVLLLATGVAEEERTDASGQWTYVLEGGCATIISYEEELSGVLTIPGEVDGYPVTGIGVEAFHMCWDLAKVIIPDSVTSIGEWAFKECYELTGVVIGSNVTSIDEMAFFGCESLVIVTLPDSMTSIGSYAFADCSSLTSVTIPAGVTYIGERAFHKAEFLEATEIVTLHVEKGSYAEQYAKENGTPYVLALPYKDLSANEILSATVEILPEKVRGDLSDDAIEDLVAILRTIETNNRDDSHNSYGGQAVIFTITMMDGTEEIISAFNPFIIINGIGYRTDVCHELSGLGGTIAKTPY
jgi:hypothetical protein